MAEGKVPNDDNVSASGSSRYSNKGEAERLSSSKGEPNAKGNNTATEPTPMKKLSNGMGALLNEASDSDLHLPVTEIHLKSHEWFGDFITKHEVPRKLFHSSIGFVTLYLYTQSVDYKKVKFPLIVAFVLIGAIDVVRLRSPLINKLYCRCVGALMRKKEIHTYNGVLWYLLGLIFSFSFFCKDIALISLFLLSWCDTAASTFGRKYGHLTPKLAKNKSLAGSIAAFIVGVVICVVFYGYFVPAYAHVNQPREIAWSPATSRLSLTQMSVVGGFVAALSEGIDLFNWDDNFTIPVMSATFMHLVITAFKAPPAPV